MIRRILWASAFVLILVFFYCWLPFMYRGTVIAMATAAVLLFFFLAQTVADFRIKDFDAKNTEKRGYWAGVAMLVLPVMFIVFNMDKYHNRLNKEELETKGVVTDGVVERAFKTSDRNHPAYAASFNMYVAFRDAANHHHIAKVEGSGYGGQQVKLVYSPEHPLLAKVLVSDEDITRYTHIPCRELTIADLEACCVQYNKTYNNDSIGQLLNRISYLWQKESKNNLWINYRKEEFVEAMLSNGIVLTMPEAAAERFAASLDTNGYTIDTAFAGMLKALVPASAGTVVYRKGNFSLMVKGETIEGKTVFDNKIVRQFCLNKQP